MGTGPIRRRELVTTVGRRQERVGMKSKQDTLCTYANCQRINSIIKKKIAKRF